jgi:hypothetical protein
MANSRTPAIHYSMQTASSTAGSSASVFMSLPATDCLTAPHGRSSWLALASHLTNWESKSKSKLCYDRRFSRPVCLGVKHPSGAYDQIFITVRQLQACWCGALSLTRGRVCRLQLLLVFASAVILVSEFKVKVKVVLRPTVQSASPSWCQAPIWGLRPDHYYCHTVAGLLMWGALSDERTGLSFARLSQQ